MGTQREIVPTIVSRKVDHLLAVKDNQPSLRAALEDASKVRKDNAPRNLAAIRISILNQLRQGSAHPKAGLKRRRKMAGWDDDERVRVVGIMPL